MSDTTGKKRATLDTEPLISEYLKTRNRTLDIVAPLEIEDFVVQTADFMSPPRWHLGHTTWFFEMVLKDFLPGYSVYDEDYLYYFNSYYERYGTRIARDRRGTRSRPTVKETRDYRQLVDENMVKLLGPAGRPGRRAEIATLIRLGIEHEMQHQELLVYDIKHLLCDLYRPTSVRRIEPGEPVSGMVEIAGGLFQLGFSGSGFAYDNEKPEHTVFIQDFAMDVRPVTNGEFLEFILDGGYGDYRWWFSEAWSHMKQEGWEGPLYWEKHDGQWRVRDFFGLHEVSDVANLPVVHVSYYEASAYAKWAGKRLPTEAEWEKTSCYDSLEGRKKAFPWGDAPVEPGRANVFESSLWNGAHGGAFPGGQSAGGCHQMIGGVWEWTTSDYVPYPGFRSDFDEYNDKWFVGQKVLRGGSFATPASHIRTTYRNFFYPKDRWQAAGFRCAKDLD